jgi:hypothetical protein
LKTILFSLRYTVLQYAPILENVGW